ncbi:unannotated protein [freshwater metagenome]|uniref:Unannotated protein n=1 Tax=freshwater metagenome TaxID=449393 RepID=A0A6J7I1T6_9ZZZZ
MRWSSDRSMPTVMTVLSVRSAEISSQDVVPSREGRVKGASS